jgi:hypothetical protein
MIIVPRETVSMTSIIVLKTTLFWYFVLVLL